MLAQLALYSFPIPEEMNSLDIDGGWIPSSVSGMLIFGGFITITIFLVSLKALFGTFNVFGAWKKHIQARELSEKYSQMLKTRETMQYHIGWSRARGEMAAANSMLADLAAFDKV